MYHFGHDQSLSIADKQALLDNFADEYHPLVEIGRRLGPDAIDIIAGALGGEKPHIPEQRNFWTMLVRESRNEQMRMEFNGSNYHELGQYWGLDETTVRKIVHRRTKQRRPPEKSASIKIDEQIHERLSVETARYRASLREIVSTIIDLAIDHPDIHRELQQRYGEQMQLAANE